MWTIVKCKKQFRNERWLFIFGACGWSSSLLTSYMWLKLHYMLSITLYCTTILRNEKTKTIQTILWIVTIQWHQIVWNSFQLHRTIVLPKSIMRMGWDVYEVVWWKCESKHPYANYSIGIIPYYTPFLKGLRIFMLYMLIFMFS